MKSQSINFKEMNISYSLFSQIPIPYSFISACQCISEASAWFISLWFNAPFVVEVPQDGNIQDVQHLSSLPASPNNLFQHMQKCLNPFPIWVLLASHPSLLTSEPMLP